MSTSVIISDYGSYRADSWFEIMQEIDQLVKMANQIADNFSFHEDAVNRLADHLQRFWAPSMRKKLIEFIEAGGDGLKPDVIAAVKRLQAN